MKFPKIDSAWAPRAFYAVAAAGVSVAVALAVQGALAGYAYWYDERFTLAVLQEPMGVAIQRFVLLDVHPPLYYGLLALWSGLFGMGEVATRSLSLLASLGVLGLLWGMGRGLLSRRALALASLWLASHWMWVTYAQEVRMYSFVMLGGIWVSLSFARLWGREDEPSPASLHIFAAGCLIASFLHYSAMALSCSALLLLLLRHRRRLSFWPPIAAVGAICLLWTFWHAAHQVVGSHFRFIAWSDWPGPAALLATLWTVFFPGRTDTFGPTPSLPLIAVWLFFAGFYALMLVQWRHRLRQEGGWSRWKAASAGREWSFLRGQLWLLGAFLVVLALLHEWKGFLVNKILMASVPSLALCFGACAVLLWRREYWRLCALALALAAVSLPVTWHGLQNRWGRWSIADRAGVREVAARLSSGDRGVRVYCYSCGRSALMLGPRDLALVAGVRPGVFAPVHLQASEPNSILHDERHLRPPFFLVHVHPKWAAMLHKQLGFEFEMLAPAVPEGSREPFLRSFYVREPE